MAEYVPLEQMPTHQECISFVRKVEEGFARTCGARPNERFSHFGVNAQGADTEMKRHTIAVSKNTQSDKVSFYTELVSEVARVDVDEAMGYLAAQNAVLGRSVNAPDSHELMDEIAAARQEVKAADADKLLLKNELSLRFDIRGHGPHQRLRANRQSDVSLLAVTDNGAQCQVVACVAATSHTYTSRAGGEELGVLLPVSHPAAKDSVASGGLQRADLLTMTRALKSFGYMRPNVRPYAGFGRGHGMIGPLIDLRFISEVDHRYSRRNIIL